jgi:hypothetical protein
MADQPKLFLKRALESQFPICPYCGIPGTSVRTSEDKENVWIGTSRSCQHRWTESDLRETIEETPLPKVGIEPANVGMDKSERPHFIAWGRTLVFAGIAYAIGYWLSGPVWALAAGYSGAALLLYGHYPHALRSSGRKAATVVLGIIIVGGFAVARNKLTSPTTAPISPVPPAPKQAEIIAPSPSTPPKTAPVPPAPKNTPNPSDSEDPINGLLKLGWTVVATGNNPTVVNFQNARTPLPDMVKSARLMKELRGKLNVGIIEASSLAGLSQLATVGNIDGLRLAGNFPDLGELRAFKRLLRLDLIGGSSLHLESVGSLTQLRELVLQQPRDRSPDLSPLGALTNLERFSVYGFAFSEIPALRTMKSLKYLDLTDTPIANLSMLRELPNFNELVIDQRSIPALRRLASSSIRTLEIKHAYGMKEPIDLSPLAALPKLKTVHVMASTSLTLAPLTSLLELSDLSIWGTSVSIETMRENTIHLVDPISIGELHQLKRLELAWVDVTDTNFMAGLESLEEVHLVQTHSLSDIRTLGTLKTLRLVQLASTNVAEISSLFNLRNLKVLNIEVSPIRSDEIKQLRDRGVTVKE